MGEYQLTFEALKIDGEDLEEIYQTFIEMDDDHSGEISIKEFFAYLDMRKTVGIFE